MYGAWSRNNGGHNAVGRVVSDCFTLNRPPQLPKRSGVEWYTVPRCVSISSSCNLHRSIANASVMHLNA